MASNNGALQQLLERQKQELESTTMYIDLESQIETRKSSSNYDLLDTAAKTQYTRRLNELIKRRDSTMKLVNNVNAHVATTTVLENSIRSNSSGGTLRTSNIRIPTLRRYRGIKCDGVSDPFYFIDQCHSLFIAHDLPEEK